MASFQMYHKGDKVKILRSDSHPELIGTEQIILKRKDEKN